VPDYRDRRDSPAMTDRNRHEDLLPLTVETPKVEKMHILHLAWDGERAAQIHDGRLVIELR